MANATPRANGFHQPAEWAEHRSVWLAWPSHAHLWQENLAPAQNEFVQLARAIADLDPISLKPRGEPLNVLVHDSRARAEADEALRGLGVTFHPIPFGDIWLRDTAPLFLQGQGGERACVRFQFNGWGGKYSLPHDPDVAEKIARAARVRDFSFPWILEGGSIEVDGEGTCLTTRQCLLNPNRNPSFTEGDLEQALRESLGVDRILWISDGLLNDHTDGHIDTIARFIPGPRVICMEARDSRDPNRDVLATIISDLSRMTDAKNRPLEIVKIPSPGLVRDDEGEIMPASFVNFYIGNRTVVVPTYGTAWDKEAVERIAACFPDRRTVGVSARAILSGGGAFHCISQQEV